MHDHSCTCKHTTYLHPYVTRTRRAVLIGMLVKEREDSDNYRLIGSLKDFVDAKQISHFSFLHFTSKLK
jgi:hypothetical protein